MNDFAFGADISWYPQMLADGYVFRDTSGKPLPLLSILRDLGFNAVRLRTWVNPSEDSHAGHCSAEETLALAKECQAAGFRIMIDFHYSDTWADPMHQVKPAAWVDLSFDELEKQVYVYTRDTMRLFTEGGIQVQWAQIGNEINPGMLLPDGCADNPGQLSRLISAGHDGVKAVSPHTLTMVHLAEFNNTELIIRYFEALEAAHCRYNMMGFSYYPYHLPKLTREECFAGFCKSMREIPARFERDIMIVETGDLSSDEVQTADLLRAQLEEAAKQPRMKGLMLWEPEGAECWSHYPLSAWRDDGTPSGALNAIRDAARRNT